MGPRWIAGAAPYQGDFVGTRTSTARSCPKPRHWSGDLDFSGTGQETTFTVRSLAPYGYISPTMLLILSCW